MRIEGIFPSHHREQMGAPQGLYESPALIHRRARAQGAVMAASN